MSFAAPVWLVVLALVPAGLAAYVLARRRARRFAIRFTAVGTLRVAAGETPAPHRKPHRRLRTIGSYTNIVNGVVVSASANTVKL